MLGRFIFAAAAALISMVSAQELAVTDPSSDLWWVSGAVNTLAWTCNTSPYTDFIVLIANSDPKILVAPLALLATQQNYDCSKTITEQISTHPAATGYTILLANPMNSTDVYATSQPFEIKAAGSPYPTTSTTAASATSTSSPSATPKSGAVVAHYAPTGLVVLVAFAIAMIVA